MHFWMNRRFGIDLVVSGGGSDKPRLNYPSTQVRNLFLTTNTGSTNIALTNDFDDKRVVLWLTENGSAGVTKASISNYSSDSIASGRESFTILSEDNIKLAYLTLTTLTRTKQKKIFRKSNSCINIAILDIGVTRRPINISKS